LKTLMMKQRLYKGKRLLLSFIYPNRCGFCEKLISYSDYYCQNCYQELELCNDKVSINNIDRAICICYYKDIAKKAVIELKDQNNGYAVSTAAKLMSDKLNSLNVNADFLIPVPISKEKRVKRGYNQSLLLAKEIAVLSDIEVKNNVLFAKEHLQQKYLTKSQRQENTKNSFYIRNTLSIKGKTIILVDDVVTTGSTLDYLALLLKKGGASQVLALVFAKTPMDNSH